MQHPKNPVSNKEFIFLMALLMSLVALAIDVMLPALDQIGSSLGVIDPNNNQLVISTIFLGMAFGLMLYGPVSDSFGRKKAIYLGIGIFLIGDLISLYSGNFTFMLIGRLCQGFGAAACRVVTLAMIRDKFSGREMGRVMSLIMVFFVLVPALAPTLGQAVLLFSDWRGIFWLLLAAGLTGVLWLHFRQPETLVKEKRLKFSCSTIVAGIKETLANKVARFYMFAAGIIFGSFIGYLSSAQQIFQNEYQLGEAFPLYFGALALAIGLSSLVNSSLVMRFPMETLCFAALGCLSVSSIGFFFYAQGAAGYPPLFMLMAYLAVTFFCFGLLFGNLNTLAIQPLGHIAGVATSVISSVQTLMSVAVGTLIGQAFDGTVLPLVFGFLACSLCALGILIYVRKSAMAPELPESAVESDYR
ncbi:MAG: DHA1 family bicyclomycin/chloramphenicol resistance-like MFS transporter [Motiliproteus sp.]|jgi:DHA1 family bicyclomycin/chloramphenicol resistance-like MFS transporter